MPAMIVFPSVVQAILASYGDLFAHAPERRHFAEYLTGLFIAERKTTADGKIQWYFTRCIRIPGVNHTVRIVPWARPIAWVVEQAQYGQSLSAIKAHLALP